MHDRNNIGYHSLNSSVLVVGGILCSNVNVPPEGAISRSLVHTTDVSADLYIFLTGFYTFGKAVSNIQDSRFKT